MDKRELVLSICIPTYNRANTVLKQVEKVIELSKNHQKMVEIIVSDNNSPDNTLVLLAECLKRASNLRILKSDTNVGLVNNLRKAYFNAKGSFVWFLGDDDTITIDNLNEVVGPLQEDGDCNLFVFNFLKRDGSFYPPGLSKRKLYSDRYHHGLMFISSLIYNRKYIQPYLDNPDVYTNITLPLGLSLLGMKSGKYRLLEDIQLVEANWGQNSWKNRAHEVNSVVKLQLLRVLDKTYETNLSHKFISFKSFYYNLLVFNLKRFLKHVGLK